MLFYTGAKKIKNKNILIKKMLKIFFLYKANYLS